MKLLIGGSPCTFWSIAQKKDRETEASGLGWELFLNYAISRDVFKPDYFLYENNKSMSPKIRAQITEMLGVEPVLINSALVSAQNRQRLYWVGKRNAAGGYDTIPVEQPKDRGILLRDVLESGVCWREKVYTLRASANTKQGVSNILRHIETNGRFGYQGVAEPVNDTDDGKCHTIKAQYYKNGVANFVTNGGFPASAVAEPVRIGTIESSAKNADFDSQQYRVYSPDGKSVTLCGNGGGLGAKTGLYAIPTEVEGADGKTYPIYEVRDGRITIKGKQYPIKLADGFYIIRKLTVTECKRLQTVPDSFEFPVSDTQAYKMLGNGWTVDVIAHILGFMEGIRGGQQPLDVFSMYDGMACGHIALDKLGANIRRYCATEIDPYCIKTATHNFPDIVELGDAFKIRGTEE